MKAVKEYEKKFESVSGRNGAFYGSDMQTIRESVRDLCGSDREFELIYNALRAGFMVGYRKGKRDVSKRRAAEKA